MAGEALPTPERAVGSGRAGSGFEGLQPTSGLGTRVHAPALQSYGSHHWGPGFPEGLFQFFVSGNFSPRKGRCSRSC